jgi:hypothetical protein
LILFVISLTTVSSKESSFSSSHYETVIKECQKFHAFWNNKYKECEGLTKENCLSLGGSFNECASPCRHIKNKNNGCITVCVPVCSFK